MANKSINISSKYSLFYKRTVLDNGLTILTERVPNYHSFSLGIFINAGSRDDFPEKNGTAHFLEHSLFRKSKKFNSKQIANKFEEYGAYTNAFTTQELVCFYVRALNPHLRKSINLLLEIILNPDFNSSEIDKERQIIIEEIKSYDDDVEELISDLGDKIVFPNHPLGNPILGTIDSIKSINADDLAEFYHNFVTPSNIVICMVGDLDHERICEYIKKQIEQYYVSKITRNLRDIPEFIIPSSKTITRPVQQAHILLLKRIMTSKDNEKYAAGVLNLIFGDGMSSRLYQNLRDKYGISYSIYSSLQLYSDSGIFSIYAATDEVNINYINDLIYQEIRKLNRISNKELQRAKNQYISGITMETESLSSRMQALVKSELIDYDYESIDELCSLISDIKKVDLETLIEKYFFDTNFFKVVILPEKKNRKKN